jgi:hypothetical protein
MSKITFVLKQTFPIHEMLTQGDFEELITLLHWIPQRVIVAAVVVILKRKTPGIKLIGGRG